MYAPPIGYDAKVAPGSVPGPTARRPLPGWSGIRSERMAASAAPARTMRIPPLRSAVKMESDVSPRTHAVVNIDIGIDV